MYYPKTIPFAFALFVIVGLSFSQEAAQAFSQPNCPDVKCEGQVQNWNKDYYQFKTYSRVFQRENNFIYQTCVENSGHKDLDEKWNIVGPNNWILKGCSDKSERIKAKRKDYGYYSPGSCFRYGNSWQFLRAKFFAHTDETADVEKDKKDKDCHSEKSSLVSPFDDIIHFIKKRIYFTAPYDEKNVERSLTKITIDVAVDALPKLGSASQFISYYSEPAYFDNKDFKFGRFRAVPAPEIKEHFAAAANGKAINKDGSFFLVQKDNIKIEYKLPSKPALASLPYTILTDTGREVGSILIPTWVERK